MNKLLFILVSSFLGSNIIAQNGVIQIGTIHTIPSKVLKEERQIAVFTPPDYPKENKKYQVLYALDGEWNFNYLTTLVDKLISSGDIPEMIVIGLINNNRSRDLTPAGLNDNKNKFGGASNFLNFINSELRPWVKSNYNIHPYEILAGHSFGGLFTLYSMMNSPDSFQAYIVLSPSLGRNDEQQVKYANEYFKGSSTGEQTLYMAIGNEEGFTKSSSMKFVKILDKHQPSNYTYKFETLENESHISITTTGFSNGLRFIYQDYNPERMGGIDEIFLMEKHYQNLSAKFRYEILVPEVYYQQFVKEQIGERELDYALFILEKYKLHYPDSPKLIQLYGDTYLLKGDFKKAKEYYSKLKTLGFEHEAIDNILRQLDE